MFFIYITFIRRILFTHFINFLYNFWFLKTMLNVANIVLFLIENPIPWAYHPLIEKTKQCFTIVFYFHASLIIGG